MTWVGRLFSGAAILAFACTSPAADWPTYRGNPQRTGCVDGAAGPKTPKVLWVYESQEHFVASPSCSANTLFISGMGAFNSAIFHAMSMEPKPASREIWGKKPPFLKLPVVCSPAVVEGRIVFGDGMHQTDGATLYCMSADNGAPVWQLPVPGQLVHLEGGPTIANGRVFIGGGAAGVICADMKRVTLDGKEQDAAAVQAQIEKKWKEMVARFEADKKKDPDFAIPPDENALPKPAPMKLWQAGAVQWHVDAPVAVVNDRVLAASARLDTEKVGDRALFCLDARDGNIKWRTPLKHNPWGGPSIAGNLAIVGCSSIRFEPKDIPEGKGEVAAINLDDGKPVWEAPVGGGVVSPIAIAGELAICTATDGKVRALAVKDGQEKWAYDAKAPMFAGAAIAGDLAYVADLKGIVHAINLTTGKAAWTLDIATDAATKAPGLAYGSPIVQGGRLFVATCNIDSPANQQKTVVICVGE